MGEYNIQSVQYTSADQKTTKVVIDGVTYFVPKKPGNRYYDAVQDWVAEGNTIQDAD